MKKIKMNWVATLGYLFLVVVFLVYRVDFHLTYGSFPMYVNGVGVDSCPGHASFWFDYGAFMWYITLPIWAILSLICEAFVRRPHNWVGVAFLGAVVAFGVYYYVSICDAYLGASEIHGKFVETKSMLAIFDFNFRDFPWYNWAGLALFPLIWEWKRR